MSEKQLMAKEKLWKTFSTALYFCANSMNISDVQNYLKCAFKCHKCRMWAFTTITNIWCMFLSSWFSWHYRSSSLYFHCTGRQLTELWWGLQGENLFSRNDWPAVRKSLSKLLYLRRNSHGYVMRSSLGLTWHLWPVDDFHIKRKDQSHTAVS